MLLDCLYLVLLVALSPWLAWQSLRTGKYRQGLAAKLFGLVPQRQSQAPCVWLHAVSVGEVNLLVPLVAEIGRTWPEWDCVISTTTRTGFALAQSRFPGLTVFYCPLDFSWAVRRAMRRIGPRLLVLAELELWPNLIWAAHGAGARVAIVNGRLSERSFRGYRRLRPLLSRLLGNLDLVAVQTPEYAQRFLALGAPPDRVEVTGSIKFDGAEADRQNAETVRLSNLAGFGPDDVVLLAGSTQEPEEQLALQTFRHCAERFPRLKLIVVPRHPERFERVAQVLTESGLAWRRRSQLDADPSKSDARILLIDRIGELRAWWGTAAIAFVGGSLTARGGQNMIEPAAYGAAVCFGPATHNFRDVVALLMAAQAAVIVGDGDDLTSFVARCLDHPAYRAELGERARRIVAAQRGATGRTMQLLSKLVRQPAEPATTAGPRHAA
ncbi:MAG TPA: 3-deoxy-D-manno-octulosonic acid transferase [Pirellulales bacterium]|jgi:3-deoxy-D-manno-octulosonic-acid transferase|nr:3-deoxy-D-manno-octulosonic acid transferase [Pirellulales bacterium]